MQRVSTIICALGKKAGVIVDRKGDKVKYASAHDLRRSFGERWAKRLLPQQLMELMRHENIETTMKYYVGSQAEATASAVWSAYEQAMRPLGSLLGAPVEKS